MKTRVLIAAVLFYFLSISPIAYADSIALGKDGTVQSVAAAHIGKKVSIILNSGKELSGKVTAVTNKAIHISELTGKEYYDAVINNKKIAAIVIRVK